MDTRDNQTVGEGYISKLYINSKKANNDVITVTTKKFSSNGDIFEVDVRVISPSVVQTESSLAELKPEVSQVYPFKIVPPTDQTGRVIIQVPTLNTEVTASQNYYVPVYFERYNLDILREIDKEFVELTLPEEEGENIIESGE
jgi:hypothetical protein